MVDGEGRELTGPGGFERPLDREVALVGGLGMGAVAIPYARSLRP